MGIMFSYECTGASNVRKIGTHGKSEVFVADLSFVNEHGHKLATQESVLVGVEDGHACVLDYPENLVEDTAEEAVWEFWKNMCDQHPAPPFSVDNPEEFSSYFA